MMKIELDVSNPSLTPLAILAEWDRNEPSVSQSLDPSLTSEILDFAYWEQIQKTYQTIGNLYGAIKEKINALSDLNESIRSRIGRNDALAILASEVRENGTYVIESEKLVRIGIGISGSYCLKDETGKNRFIVKPIDEDAGCLNNPKGYATPFDFSPIRTDMPLYFSPFRESAAWEIANAIGVGSVAPKTVLAIIESDSFSELSEQVSSRAFERFLKEVGPSSREKLCSVQEFIPNSKSLFEALQELQRIGFSDEEIAHRFDQRDYEDANILLWTTYDTDGHADNFLCYPKGSDHLGNEILGLKKIDNGLAFPDRNRQFRNHLAYLPNANSPLSDEGKAKIAAINIESIARKLKANQLDSAVPAFRLRIAYLKKLALKPGITIKEINRQMRNLR